MKRLFVLVYILLAVAAVLPAEKSSTAAYPAVITAVVDGDTVKMRFSGIIPENCSRDERVRLIGVNTPEMHGADGKPEYYAEEAADYTDRYWKSSVLVVFDYVTGLRDAYGRLLAYIITDDEPGNDNPENMLNYRLIREGYGYFYGNFKFYYEMMELFSEAQDEAKNDSAGLWQ
jgi:micrococcal nuclease